MRFKPHRPIWLLVATATLLSAPVVAAPTAENVLVTFRVGTLEQGKDVVLKTYELVVHSSIGPAEMTTGARIPIPTTSFKVGDDGNVPNPITSYTYQHVGFSAKINAILNEDGTIFLKGHVEDSSLADRPEKTGRPFIQSMTQNIAVMLDEGEPLRIHHADETDTRSLFIEIQAERLDAGERIAGR